MANATYGANGKARIDVEHQVIVMEAHHGLDPRHPVDVIIPFAQFEQLYITMRQIVLQLQGNQVQVSRGPTSPEVGAAPAPIPGLS